MSATASRPPLPAVTIPAAPKCRNAEPGSYNHECGKPAAHAVTYWGMFEEWYTTFYCPQCFKTGTEAQDARARAVRSISF